MAEHGYQAQDRHIIDYHIFELPGIAPYPGGGLFRGPAPALDRPYIACLGSAHTFGRFCKRPYPALLQERFGIGALNLGTGGASPTFCLENERLLEYTNNAKLAIVQVLSARSQSNALFTILDHGMHGTRLSDNTTLSADEFYEDLLRTASVEQVKQVVQETRDKYVQNMIALLHRITCPTILFWFAVRTPAYQEKYDIPFWKLFGSFPQLVNQEMVDAMRPHADRYVQVVSSAGLPQKLYDRSGRSTTVSLDPKVRDTKAPEQETNGYYPSPEMHEIAARTLNRPCVDLLRSSQIPRRRWHWRNWWPLMR
jgi:hypothetical protein